MNQLQSKYPQEIQAILAKYPADRKRSAVMPLLYLAHNVIDNFLGRAEASHLIEEAVVSSHRTAL